MPNRVGEKTAGAVISTITTSLKEYTKKIVPPELWLDILNSKVDMINEAMGTKDKAIYHENIDLVSSDLPKGIFSAASDDSTYDNATRTITFGSMTLAPHGQSFNADFIGSRVQMFVYAGTTGYHNSFYSEIESIDTGANSIVIKNAFGSNVIAGRLTVIVSTKTDDDILNIGNESWYKRIDTITAIYDSALNDECIDAETVNNFYSMRKSQMGVGCSYRNSILWVRDGEYLMFVKGASINAYGTRTMHIIRLPYSCTTNDDIVDIPKSMLDLLYSLCMLAGLQRLQVPIPTELKSAENQISVMKAAKEEEIAKLLANKKD